MRNQSVLETIFTEPANVRNAVSLKGILSINVHVHGRDNLIVARDGKINMLLICGRHEKCFFSVPHYEVCD